MTKVPWKCPTLLYNHADCVGRQFSPMLRRQRVSMRGWAGMLRFLETMLTMRATALVADVVAGRLPACQTSRGRWIRKSASRTWATFNTTLGSDMALTELTIIRESQCVFTYGLSRLFMAPRIRPTLMSREAKLSRLKVRGRAVVSWLRTWPEAAGNTMES